MDCREHCNQILHTRSKQCITLAEQELNVAFVNQTSVCILAANSWVSNKADLPEKTCSDEFLRKVSSGSHSIKGSCYIIAIQNKSITNICQFQMFGIKYSACLFFCVWCLLRCNNTSVWHESHGWTPADRRGWKKCSDSLKSNPFQHFSLLLYRDS